MRYGIKTLFTLFILFTFYGCKVFSPTAPKDDLYTFAFYTVESLYDTKNDSAINDEAYLPEGRMKWTEERYNTKIKNLATTIATMGGKAGPTVIGLCEVENKQVLEDLLNNPALRDRKYEIIHYDSEDETGLDIALLYKPRHFKLSSHASIPIDFAEANYKTRGILQVKGQLRGKSITLYVTHWPDADASQKISERRKRAAAVTLRQEINAQQELDQDAKIIVMGNFGEDPSSAVMEQVVVTTGRPDPAFNQELYNTFYMHYVQNRGSSFYRGKFQMHDQILVSKAFIGGEGLQFVRGSATIHDPEHLKYTFGKYKNTPRQTYVNANYRGGTSNHFPIYIKLQVEK